MRNLVAFIVWLQFVQFNAISLDDGIYLMSQEMSDKSVVLQDNKIAYVGEKEELKNVDAKIFSKNSLNSEYYLNISFSYVKGIDAKRHVLVVDNIGFENGGGANSGEAKSNIHFNVRTREHAERIAKYFGIPLHLREHPGHKIEVSFTPEQEKYSIGDEIRVIFRVKNLGENPVAFYIGGHYRFSSRDNRYTFSGEYHGTEGAEQLLDVGSSDNHGGLMTTHTLPPDGVYEDEVVLNKWFTFDQPGYYSILGSFYMEYGDLLMKQWEEYVSARFSFKVQAKEIAP